MRFAFDFFGTLDTHESVREIARRLFERGHEIHIVSAISPSIEFDYIGELAKLKVKWSAIHRVDHDPQLKVDVLIQLDARGFWDDLAQNVWAARLAGIPSCLVGKEPAEELRAKIK